MPVNWGENAADWLLVKGVETIMEAGKLRDLGARVRLGRWRKDAADDEWLRELIHESAAVAATDTRFLRLVGEAVARRVHERTLTLALPLGPVTVRRDA